MHANIHTCIHAYIHTCIQIMIKEVFPGYAAERSGKIMPGDLLLAVDGQSVEGCVYVYVFVCVCVCM